MSVKVSIEVFKELEPQDFRVLSAIELNMSRYEYVPSEAISHFLGMDRDELLFRISRLHRFKLILRRRIHVEGFALTYLGYDCLALNAFVKGGVLEALGPSLGVGKESDVYSALSPSQEALVVKLHRLGRISFRQTRRARGYVADRRHTSWLYQSRLAAEREYEALQFVFPKVPLVPKPIAQNRHAVVMSYFAGEQLLHCRVIDEPEQLMQQILQAVKEIYTRLGIIHADLSEYNVLIKEDGSFIIIDWPQYVTHEHPDARTLIERDVKTICSFFYHKFSVKVDPKHELNFLGEQPHLPQT